MADLKTALRKAKKPIIVAQDLEDEGFQPTVIAEYRDPELGTMVWTNRNIDNYSPVSGNDLVETAQSKRDLTEAEFAKLTELACCHECSTRFLALAEVVAAAEGEAMSCTVCGEQLTVAAKSDDEEEDDTDDEDDESEDEGDEEYDDEDDTDDEDDESEDEGDEEDDTDEDGVAALTFDDDDESEDEGDDETGESAITSDKPDDMSQSEFFLQQTGVLEDAINSGAASEDLTGMCEALQSCFADNEATEAVTTAADALFTAVGAGDSDAINSALVTLKNAISSDEGKGTTADKPPAANMEDNEMATVSTAIASVDTVLAGIRGNTLGLVPLTGRVAFLDAQDRVVARCVREKASESVKPLFDNTERLADAIQQALDADESETLASFGFELSTIDVKIKDVVNDRVRAETASLTENLRKDRGAVKDRLKQSVQTAFLGVTKGCFKGVENPLRSQLVASLKSVNVHSAEGLVDRALATAADDLFVAVFAKVDELEAKSDDARSEVASMVADAGYTAPVVSLEEARASRTGSMPIMSIASPPESKSPETATVTPGSKLGPRGENRFTDLLSNIGAK